MNAEPVTDVLPLIRDYPVDQEEGLHQLITWFLNFVTEEEEDLLQSGAGRDERNYYCDSKSFP